MARSKRRPKHTSKTSPRTASAIPAALREKLTRAQQALRGEDLLTAEHLAAEVLQRSPRNAGAAEVLARVHAVRGRFDLAVRRLEPVARRHPDLPELQRLLADYLRRAGFHRRAIDLYESVRRDRPEDLDALQGLCTSLVMVAQRDRVRSLLEPVLDSGRGTPAMSVTYVRAVLDGRDDEAAVRIAREHLGRPDLGETHKRRLHALIGKGLERLGRYDEAFDAYCSAAEHERAPFDRDAYRTEIDALVGFFTTEWFERCERSSLTTDRPVFVVGMPRSGSTLLERVLDAHPNAHAIGEHPAMYDVLDDLKATLAATTPWPEGMKSVTENELDRLGTTYLDRVQADLPSPDARVSRLIDKALWNTHTLGLIAMLFPNARVIWSRRRAEDACFSCFAESFPPQLSPYASDLGNLGFVQLQTDRLMRHWMCVLPIPVLDVQYEDFIAEQEPATRRLLEFVGLPWDDDCLQFHEKASHATTLSHEQVRQPLYASAVGRAQRFASHLGPLREALRTSTVSP